MSHSIPTYLGGQEARVGDIVTLNRERSGVEAVIAHELVKQCDVNEPGLLLQNASFGRVFIPESRFFELCAYAGVAMYLIGRFRYRP